jgi:hypothetical protein
MPSNFPQKSEVQGINFARSHRQDTTGPLELASKHCEREKKLESRAYAIPSVGIDGMDDGGATYHKKSDAAWLRPSLRRSSVATALARQICAPMMIPLRISMYIDAT